MLRALILEDRYGVDSVITFGADAEGPYGIQVDIDNPWEGDTQTGFGRSASCHIQPEDIPRLIAHLQALLEGPTK